MKTLKCDICEVRVNGETFEEWMVALLPHYMEVHADVMNNNKKTEESRQRWLVENRARFDSLNQND